MTTPLPKAPPATGAWVALAGCRPEIVGAGGRGVVAA
jgi:hypothetical protein